MTRILRIDSSAKTEGSTTHALLDRIEAQVGRAHVTRDLGGMAVPQIDGTWVASTFTKPEERTAEHRAALAFSDELVAELQAADLVLIGLPVYNFTVPGALKAWIDLVCRVGVTFRYTEQGPEGLLKGKRAIVAYASGGTKLGAPNDYASPYMRYVLGFLGITDVTFVAADAQQMDADAAQAQGAGQIAALAA